MVSGRLCQKHVFFSNILPDGGEGDGRWAKITDLTHSSHLYPPDAWTQVLGTIIFVFSSSEIVKSGQKFRTKK